MHKHDDLPEVPPYWQRRCRDTNTLFPLALTKIAQPSQTPRFPREQPRHATIDRASMPRRAAPRQPNSHHRRLNARLDPPETLPASIHGGNSSPQTATYTTEPCSIRQFPFPLLAPISALHRPRPLVMHRAPEYERHAPAQAHLMLPQRSMSVRYQPPPPTGTH